MRFAHLADVHIGAWRDTRMKQKVIEAFCAAMQRIKDEHLDFVIIAGDLFHTALPPIDHIRIVVQQLRALKDTGIPVYVIAGSHDYSPGGKTMLDVLEEARLVTNVMRGTVEDKKLHLRFTQDPKTGAKLCGIIGKAGMLDQRYYEMLDRSPLEVEGGAKIFLFHTAITEFTPEDFKDMKMMPLSYLPKGFDYYAGGHVHYRYTADMGSAKLVFPGPVFPANFKELEDLQHGSFVLVDDGKPEVIPIPGNPVISISVDLTGKTVPVIQEEMAAQAKGVQDAIIAIRLTGRLHEGRLSDIDLKGFIDELYERGAYFVMRNTSGVQLDSFEAVRVDASSKETIERRIIEEHAEREGFAGADDKAALIVEMMQSLAQEKDEAEKTADFEERTVHDAYSVVERHLNETFK